MPRTRTELERDAKVAEILDAAEHRLLEGGYDALSVVGIARELNVAQNAVYWYFPSKDHLFVATMQRLYRQIAARKPRRSVGKTERILWFTDEFATLSTLRGAMNERARESEVVAEFVQQLEATLTRMFSNALREDVPEERLPLAVETFRATVEGTFARGLDRKRRRQVLTFALEQLVG